MRGRVRLLIWKEFVQLRRDRVLIAMLFAMPIVQLLLLGYVVSADITHLPTAVVDLDNSPVSRNLISRLDGSSYFSITLRPQGEADLPDLIDEGHVVVGVVIDHGTQERLQRGERAPIGIIVDGSDSRTSAVGASYLTQIIAGVNQELFARQGLEQPGPSIDANVRVLHNPSLAMINTMIPGLVALIVMISLMAIMSQSVVKERERGTLEQVFVTPIRPGEYLFSKVVPYALLAAVQSLVVLTVGIWWFRVPFAGSAGVVALGMGLFMLTAIGMGLLVSVVSSTRTQAIQTTMFIMIPTMLLSGFVFPLESMPEWVLPFTYLIPLRFALTVVRGAMVKGATISDLSEPLLILAAFAVVIFAWALTATMRRLDQ